MVPLTFETEVTPLMSTAWDVSGRMRATTTLDSILIGNMRTPVRIATWNVLSLAHSGYQEAIIQQLVRC